MTSSHLILGGARSGKSRFALSLPPPRARVVFVATAEPGDADMAQRIARHRLDRPRHWLTVEEPHDLAGALERLRDQAVDTVIVDCLTLWASNRLLRGDEDKVILEEAERVAGLIESRGLAIVLVSNEVGQGVHPATADGLRFRDLLGLVNQRLAAACEAVTLMVAGVPVTVKSPPATHDSSHQAS